MSTEKAPEKPKVVEKPAPAGKPLGADDLKTEQEKGKLDPVSPAEPSPGPVETIEEQGIGSKQPYPTKEG